MYQHKISAGQDDLGRLFDYKWEVNQMNTQATNSSCMKYTADDFYREMKRCLNTFQQPYANDHQLAPAMKILREGAEAGDPRVMFLWGEFLFWGPVNNDFGVSWGASYDDMFDEIEFRESTRLYFGYGNSYRNKSQYLFERMDEDNDLWYPTGGYYWYKKSAEAGYVPAMCWLGWCAMRGIGMKPNEAESNRWFKLAEESHPIYDLIPQGLDLFADTAIELGELAHDLDLEEDIAADQGYSTPWPTWRDLFEASMMTYTLGCELGCPRCALPIYEFQAYDYDSCDSLIRRRMCLEKRMCQIWCALNGIGLRNIRKDTILSWLIDTDRAIHYGKWRSHMSLDEETEKLLHEMTGRVLRLI